jgi:hypothetical protein
MNYVDLQREIHRLEAGLVSAWAADVLTEIVEGRRPVRAVRHPLGFICLPVERTGEDGVCVHLWQTELAAAASTTSQVHSHSWDLDSYVLFGEVRNEIVEVVDEPVKPTHRVFEVRSRGDVDEICATPRLVRHATGTIEVNRAGESYTLRAGAFHTTVVRADQPAATVALGRGRAGGKDLTLGAIDGHTHIVRRQHCDETETIRAARTVADRATARRS